MGHRNNTGPFDLRSCGYFHRNMSRRKQSNPKPVKRQADGEADDTEMTEKLQSNDEAEENNQSNDLSQSEDENEPMETGDTIQASERLSPPLDERDKESDRLENGHVSPSLLEVMRKSNFPSDILTLKKLDESKFCETGVPIIPWMVLSAIPLPKGSSIGPYTGEMVALSDLKEKEHVLQFQAGDNKFAFVSVTDKTGAWLSLLRPADKSAPHNTCVYFEGERIWCETVEDLAVGTELVASFTAGVQPSTPEKSDGLVKQEPELVSDEEANAEKKLIGGKSDNKTTQKFPPQPALIFGCPFCGVRFSSPRTLDAHLTFYCSKKPPDLQKVPISLSAQMAVDGVADKDSDRGSASPNSDSELTRTSVKRSNDESSDSSPSDSEAPKSKSPKSGQTFKCDSCDYTADRMSSLNRHKRMHSRGPENSISSERLSVSPVCQSETFCKDCNIQFTSLNTYRGHREFYCKFRLKEKSEDNISVGSSPPLKDANKMSPKLVSPPPGVLTAKGLLQASTIPHPLQFAHGSLLMQAVPKDLQALFSRPREQELPASSTSLHRALSAATVAYKHSDDQPLDLSTSKSKAEDTADDAEEKAKATGPLSVKTEQKTSPQPSPTSGKLLSPAIPKADAKSEDIKLSSPEGKPTLKVPIFPTNQGQFMKNKPVPPLSSVSRCVECNIVFYKHENYLIHKEHYCSGRRGGISLENEQKKEIDMNKSPAKPHTSPGSKQLVSDATKTHDSASPTSPKLAKGDNLPAHLKSNELCYLYFCIPCNIKFSSAGTLKAHKEFYCPYGKENNAACVVKDNGDGDSDRTSSDSNDLYRCELCHSEYTSARLLKLHFCTGIAAQAPLLRCPYCEYVTQTENRLSEHMKVHVPTKAFKCTLCGYRGNTARGMRMHGKMHLENGEEYTDDNMIEYEEPPLVPVQRNGVCDKGPVDIETELIRMKNEPYKRRRSRKSFEKSENMPSYISSDFLPQICAACGQAFANINEFVIHLRMHEMAALEAMKSLKSLKCEHCDDYIAESLTGLLFHMQERHPEQLPNTNRSENQSESEGERSQSRDSHRSVSEDRSRSGSEESSRTCPRSETKDSAKLNEKVNKIDTAVEYDQSDIPKNKLIVENDKHRSDENEESQGIRDQFDKKFTSDESERSVRSPVISDNRHQLVGPNAGSSLDGNKKSLCSPALAKSPPKAQKESSVSPPAERLWYQKPLTPVLSPDKACSPENRSKSSPGRTNQIGPVSPSREAVAFSSQTGSLPLLPLQRSQMSPLQHSLSPWKQALSTMSAIKSEPISPLSSNHSENQRQSPFQVSVKKEAESSPRSEKSSSSQRPSNPPTPVTPPNVTLPRNVLSPNLHNFPFLYHPQALSLMRLYQLHGMPPVVPPAAGGSSNTPDASAEENSSRKYCKHCDINFTYLSSFLTHKKYYCSARPSPDEMSPSASA